MVSLTVSFILSLSKDELRTINGRAFSFDRLRMRHDKLGMRQN
ncbi:hypothetical protein MNBD_ALPHA12-1792 [hydrothermal vent metagenome]|uniref:Uncharacterized protein n=1 Tax=hydrothermal vent metagenome TaxID=652676 RepID=A0A3B0TWG3_9ZZZZ